MSKTKDELRQRVDRLEKRVAELERVHGEQDTNHSAATKDGLDSRDATVVGMLEHGDRYSVRDLKQFYKTQTDVRRDKTAKSRVKQLTQRDFLKQDGRRFIYRG